MHRACFFLTLVFVLLCGCSPEAQLQSDLGVAYVGVERLDTYVELSDTSPVAETLAFGSTVNLVRQRRNFYFVRSSSGKQGWVHRSSLFNEKQTFETVALSRLAARMEPQGEASVFAPLNVHNFPNRSAPTIWQMQEEDAVEVLAHEVHVRQAYDPGPLMPEGRQRGPTESEENALRFDPLPPPGLPPAWLLLSGYTTEEIAVLAAEGVANTDVGIEPIPNSDLWTLVRRESGLAGWVLNSRLVMQIPDRVAQYAEGRRIAAYFPLEQAASDPPRYHWLWATRTSSQRPYGFDGFRVFIWSRSRSRFETSYIRRRVEGYLPIQTGRDREGRALFHLLVRENGLLQRRSYRMEGVRTVSLGAQPYMGIDPLLAPSIMDSLPAYSPGPDLDITGAIHALTQASTPGQRVSPEKP
jgi:hypothetical protein